MAAHDDDTITGAFGTIKHGDNAHRSGMRTRLLTLLAILGPGIIVMVGGKVLLSGTPAEIAHDPRVREVYLGRKHHA